ncbi:Exonuclease GOR [Araneus ventricosus]|uniref:Exonuclease GOR n=1 Tax=Araneus ventricosus TaxID=182803 RepID=A0A4Y2KI36_ARAVE|nr:Exonuclease GOR [Araneus ventricosus]
MHTCYNPPTGSAPCISYNHNYGGATPKRSLAKPPSRRYVQEDFQDSVFQLDSYTTDGLKVVRIGHNLSRARPKRRSEMCYTTVGLEVVRLGLVNVDGLPVYDGYVKPNSKVLDYNTIYSGVEKSHLQNVTVTLDDMKTILSGYIQEDTILVGHALNNYLSALGLIHSTIVDMSVLYADPRTPSKKTALKKLASFYLGLKIQDSASGHDCIDDARATLQLALLKVPEAVPMPFSEQTRQAAKQQAAETYLWKQEQRPLVQIQNFDCRFGHEMFDFCQQACGANSPLVHNPNLGCYTPYLRGGV